MNDVQNCDSYMFLSQLNGKLVKLIVLDESSVRYIGTITVLWNRI
jgi:hypothetical protein